MAIAISDKGRFELTALSSSPSMIAYGEQFTLTMTLKNRTGAAITRFLLYAHVSYKNALTAEQIAANPGIGTRGQFDFDVYSDENAAPPHKAISWANGAEKTFTLTGTFAATRTAMHPVYDEHGDYVGDVDLNEPDRSGRVLQLVYEEYFAPGGLTLSLGYMTKSGGDDDMFPDDLSGGFSGTPTVLSHRWSPAVALAIQRGVVRSGSATPDDEGERLMITSRLATSAHADPSRMFCRLYYANDAEADMDDSYVDLTASIPALLAGVTDDVSVVPRTFSNGSDWYFLLAFGDRYETAFAPASIALAFANMHLSGASTGGAAFGRYSSSTEGNPKLESAYPFYAYGGIEGVTNYAPGEVDTGGRWIDGKPVYRSVLTGTTPASATSGQWVTLATVPDLDTPIRFTGFVQRYMLPAAIGTMNIAVHVGAAGEIMLNFQNYVVSFRNQPFLFIVEYTKTTD